MVFFQYTLRQRVGIYGVFSSLSIKAKQTIYCNSEWANNVVFAICADTIPESFSLEEVYSKP